MIHARRFAVYIADDDNNFDWFVFDDFGNLVALSDDQIDRVAQFRFN